MNKLTSLLILSVVFAIKIHAQTGFVKDAAKSKKEIKQHSCRKAYIGPVLGLNTMSGMIGAQADIVVHTHISTGIGLGFGSWGYKIGLSGKYYFKECHRGWAIGGELTYATGVKNLETEMQLVSGGNQAVKLNLLAMPGATVSAYRYWGLGRKGHRIHMQMGWNQALRRDKYDLVSNHVLSAASDYALRFVSPGGLVLGAGFTFGIGR